jgi:hypothetical protein
MPDVVKKRRGSGDNACFRADRISRPEKVEHARHEMHYSQRMSKAGVFCALIGVEREAKLFDVAQALKFARVDQIYQQRIIGPSLIEGDYVVDGIAVDTFHMVVGGRGTRNQKAKGKRQKAKGKNEESCARHLETSGGGIFIFAFCLLPFAF